MLLMLSPQIEYNRAKPRPPEGASPLTYCLTIKTDQGLVFASDSRTNAGVDQVSTFSKMHTFESGEDRVFCLLSSGNLATTQAVLRQIRRDNEQGGAACLDKVRDMAEAAEYVGSLSRAEQRKHGSRKDDSFNPEASFILGGQIANRQHQIYQVYPEGNYIVASEHAPFLQIGELKYGKPILDRIVTHELSLELAARCALVSMDSTIRSNVTVGPPIELLLYKAGSLKFNQRLVLQEDNPYLSKLRQAWQEGLKTTFENLPAVPFSRPSVQLVDAQGDQ
jgi:putative proteasome-type protease